MRKKDAQMRGNFSSQEEDFELLKRREMLSAAETHLIHVLTTEANVAASVETPCKRSVKTWQLLQCGQAH